MKVLKEYENKLLKNNIFGKSLDNKKWPVCISIRCWFYEKLGKFNIKNMFTKEKDELNAG